MAIGAASCGLVLVLSVVAIARAQQAPMAAAYPQPTSFDAFRYPDQAAEIALAKTAAPAAIADDADVLVMGAHGYDVAVKGKNGFVCLVDRSWSKDFNDTEFWDPHIRAPMCLNAAAARSVLPIYQQRASWALNGASKDEIMSRTAAAMTAKTLPTPEIGNMVFMMSKDAYLSEVGDHRWHSHIMFYEPLSDRGAWGAGQKGVPIGQADDPAIGISTFFVLTTKWSDGTSAVMEMQH